MCVCVLESTCIITSLWLGLILPHSRFFEYKSQEGKPIVNASIPLHNFHMVGKGAVIVTESKGRDRGHEVRKERQMEEQEGKGKGRREMTACVKGRGSE